MRIFEKLYVVTRSRCRGSKKEFSVSCEEGLLLSLCDTET